MVSCRAYSAVLAELADAHGSGPCEATHGGSNPLDRTNVGMWLSLVERLVRDEEAAGSNPVIPTNSFFEQVKDVFN